MKSAVLMVLKDWVIETNDTPRILIQQLDQLGEIGERAGEPVDLVDRMVLILPALTSVGRTCRAGRSSEAPEEGAIVVTIGNKPPTLMAPTLYIGLASFALGIEQVEFESRLCSVSLRV